MNVFVTGGTGFIGSHLVKRFAKEYDVYILTRPGSDISLITDSVAGSFKYDGSYSSILSAIEKSAPTLVVHLASYFLAQHTADDIKSLVDSNILLSTQLVQAMVQRNVQYLINTETSWQHYNDEDYNPVCLYAATKQAFNSILRFFQETNTLRCITLKLFDTYGPGDSRKKLIPFLLKALSEQISLDMSPGEQLLDFVYIDDVVNAYLIAANRLLGGNVTFYEEYGVSSERRVALKQLVTLFQSVANNELHINWGGREYRPREVMCPWTKSKQLPGWRPLVDLEDGLARVIKSL